MSQISGFMEKMSRLGEQLTKTGLAPDLSIFLASNFLNVEEKDFHLLLDCFRVFEAPVQPAELFYSEKGSCFFNAACNSKESKGALFAVEGFATTVIPIMHAWNVQRCGSLILDSTWYNALTEKPGGNYFGAVVRPEFLARHLQKCLKGGTYYSILDLFLLRRMDGVKPSDVFFLREESLV